MINVDVKLEFDKIFNEVLEKKKTYFEPYRFHNFKFTRGGDN